MLLLNNRAIFVTSAKQSEAHVLTGCIKNCSIVKLYNKVLIIEIKNRGHNLTVVLNVQFKLYSLIVIVHAVYPSNITLTVILIKDDIIHFECFRIQSCTKSVTYISYSALRSEKSAIWEKSH